MPPILYLIDGHALAYRTYFAITGAGKNTDRWTTSKGEPTAGVFGFTSVLLRIFEQEKPEYIAVAFDVGKTFRDEMYADYKATREKMPDDLRTQIERIKELVDAFNIPRLEMPGFEADDVLGSAAKLAISEGFGAKIITGDKDLLQLVEDNVIVSLPGKRLADSRDYNADAVMEVMGCRPDQVVDYKAMVGDTSDNIPGIRGIGKVTATRLLAKYDNLDTIYEHLEELKPGEIKKFTESKEKAYLSQELAQIITNLEVPMKVEDAKTKELEPEKVRKVFQELEFRTLNNRLSGVFQLYGVEDGAPGEQMNMFGGAASQSSRPVRKDTDIGTIVVDDEAGLKAMLIALNKADLIAYDTETTSTDQMQADLVGISLAVNGEEGYYIPVGHKAGKQLAMEHVLEALTAPLTNPNIPKAAHNFKYDYVMLKRYGLEVSPVSFDTMIAEWVRDPGSRNLGLKNLSWTRLGIQMTEISELIGKGKKQITMAEVPIDKAAPYAAADAAVVYQLVSLLREDLEKENLLDLFNDMEMPLIEILSEMEMAGIALDDAYLANMSETLNTRMLEIRDAIFNQVGTPFNLNSTQQLSNALFNQLGITPPDGTKKTASGHYSTNATVLEALKEKHPIVEQVLEYREMAKLKSTYVDALPTQINPTTGRVHTSYNQVGTSTGRIASQKPNLQNIPIRTELGRKVRDAFVAEEGNVLLAVDYSQVELRIVAHMADDKAMLDAFLNDQDIHATTAAAINNVSLEEVTKEMRRHAKAINFGLIYGMSAFGLTRTTDLTLAEAENFVKAYFTEFPGVRDYLDEIKRKAAKDEFVETLLGRKRYFRGLGKQKNRLIRQREEREAINAPIQGTAADIMKLAMLKVSDALNQSGLKAKILLQVHDELVLECPVKELEKTVELVKKEMSSAYKISVPLKTDARSGLNWGKMN